jgi:cobalamin-dependent methionine synthase I
MVRVAYYSVSDLPSPERKEILRYAGAKEGAEGVSALLGDCLTEAEGSLSFGVCYRLFPIEEKGDFLSLGFTQTKSEVARRALAECDTVLLFAATVGHGLDRLLSRYSRLSPARALLLQAIGAERIEALCEHFLAQIGEDVKEAGSVLCPRFSPGYGDLPLALQKDIFAALDATKRLGLTLNESLLMTPSKSVTAIVGIKNGRRYEA